MKAICAIRLGLVLGLSAPAACSRPSGSEVSPSDVAALAKTGKFSEALREGKRLVDREPDSADAHHAYGFVLAKVFRYEEAAGELARARTLAPDRGDVASEYALTLAQSGRTDEAREVAAEVARRWPEMSRDLQPHIEGLDRKGRQARNAALPAGSGSAFAAAVMGKLAEGRTEEFLRDDVDPASLAQLASGSSSVDLAVIAAVMVASFNLSLNVDATDLRGYEVVPETREASGRTVVTVLLFTARRVAAEGIPAMERALASPQAKVPLYSWVAERLRALDPADRRASLVALAAHPVGTDIPIELELTGGHGAWKVADMTLGDLRATNELAKASRPSQP